MRTLHLILIILLFGFKSTYGCSGFYIAKGEKIFAGNNEDFNYPLTRIWTVTGSNDKYGRIYFGYDDYNPQGGINENGLFFDGFATDRLPIQDTSNKPRYDKFFDDIRDEIMSSCANVEEVIMFLDTYNLSENSLFENAMLFYGDALGNSIIIDGGKIIPKTKNFQVVTNFHVSKENNISCERYLTATRLLENMSNLSVDACKDILDSVHVSNTLYSQVYDIENMKIHIYNFHNYRDCYIVDIKKELNKTNTYSNLPELFKPSNSYEDFKIQNLDKRYYTSYNERFNKEIGNNIDSGLLGNYRYISLQLPGMDAYDIMDTLHLITIGRDNKSVYLQENYSAFKRFIISPEKTDLYFYFARSYRADIIFKPDNEVEVLYQTYYPVFKWNMRLKRYEP